MLPRIETVQTAEQVDTEASARAPLSLPGAAREQVLAYRLGRLQGAYDSLRDLYATALRIMEIK